MNIAILKKNKSQEQKLEYWNAFNDNAFQSKEFAKTFNKKRNQVGIDVCMKIKKVFRKIYKQKMRFYEKIGS